MKRSTKASRKALDPLIDRLGEPTIVDRHLLARVLSLCEIRRPSDCWIWTGGKGDGYGRVKVGGRLALAHRAVAYAIGLVREPFDPERRECVLHSCDNPACCNPRHLTAGTLSDNMKDCAEKGRLYVQRADPRLKLRRPRESRKTVLSP